LGCRFSGKQYRGGTGVGQTHGISLAGSHSTASDQNMLKVNKYYSAARDPSAVGEVVDFIGPSLDIGFRLGGLATPRRLICSVELAWLISKALDDKKVRSVRDLAENCEDNSSVFHISERQALKGVLDGVPYPIIWIDIGEHKGFNKIEDDVLGSGPLTRVAVVEYCEAFIESCNVDYLFLPFISGRMNPTTAYVKKYEKLLSKWQRVLEDHEAATPKEDGAAASSKGVGVPATGKSGGDAVGGSTVKTTVNVLEMLIKELFPDQQGVTKKKPD
jgi:hypothetical protein